MTVTRRQAREWAIQMLTAADLNPPTDVTAFINAYWAQLATLDPDDGRAEDVRGKLKAFAEERVAGVLADLKDIDASLVALLDHWDLYRIGTVERAVLRMGVWEIKNTDIPRPVVINEAIDLANWFSTPRARTLINGILDRFGREG